MFIHYPLVLGICGGKKKEIPDVPLNFDENKPYDSMAIGATGGAAPAQRGNMMSSNFKAEAAAAPTPGMVNNREAPENFKNTGEKFDMKSVNFSNITDFRGDQVDESKTVMNKLAKTKGASGMMTHLQGDDSDEEYYTTDESDVDGPPPVQTQPKAAPPLPPVNNTLQPAGKYAGLDSNIAYGGAMPNQRSQSPGFQLNSLSFTPEEVESRMNEMTASTRSKKRVKKKKKVRTGKSQRINPEVKREKVKRKKKRKKRHGEEDEDAIMAPSNM